MKAKKIKVWVCDECSEAYVDEADAVECCPTDSVYVYRYQCSECEEIYEDIEEARDCCKD